jgi:hypothetical protein
MHSKDLVENVKEIIFGFIKKSKTATIQLLQYKSTEPIKISPKAKEEMSKKSAYIKSNIEFFDPDFIYPRLDHEDPRFLFQTFDSDNFTYTYSYNGLGNRFLKQRQNPSSNGKGIFVEYKLNPSFNRLIEPDKIYHMSTQKVFL